MIFYDIVLKQPIGNFPAGTRFASAEILHEKGILQLNRAVGTHMDSGHMTTDVEVAGEFNLHYRIGEPVTLCKT